MKLNRYYALIKKFSVMFFGSVTIFMTVFIILSFFFTTSEELITFFITTIVISLSLILFVFLGLKRILHNINHGQVEFRKLNLLLNGIEYNYDEYYVVYHKFTLHNFINGCDMLLSLIERDEYEKFNNIPGIVRLNSEIRVGHYDSKDITKIKEFVDNVIIK